MELIELCAGTAAVSLSLFGCVPPTGYMGSKSRYADQITQLLNLKDSPKKLTLVDPGPWGRAWKTLTIDTKCQSVIDIFETWSQKTDEELFESCKQQFLNCQTEECEWAASFLWLQSRILRNMPVDERWKYKTIQKPYGNLKDPYKGRRVPTINGTIKKLTKIRDVKWPNDFIILNDRANSVVPKSDAIIYIDPPYNASTIHYQYNLSRQDLIDLALNWHNAGSRVVISEQEPVFANWHSIQLKTHSQRTFSNNKVEWLTSNQPFC
jgi:site-specific DNA-adenine methylase